MAKGGTGKGKKMAKAAGIRGKREQESAAASRMAGQQKRRSGKALRKAREGVPGGRKKAVRKKK